MRTHAPTSSTASATPTPKAPQARKPENAPDLGTASDPRFEHDLGRIRIHSGGPPAPLAGDDGWRGARWFPVQAKLTVSAREDAHEQEADRVADQIVRRLMASIPAITALVRPRVGAPTAQPVQADGSGAS